MLLHNLQRSPAVSEVHVSWNERLHLLIVIALNENNTKLIRTQNEKQSVTALHVSVKICDSLSMSELNFPLSELRKLEEGGESFCSCMGLDTSPLRAPMNEIVLCCLLYLTSPETAPVKMKVTCFGELSSITFDRYVICLVSQSCSSFSVQPILTTGIS